MTSDENSPPKTSETEPPAANQGRDEPIPTTPDESGQAGSPAGDADEDSDSSGAGGAGALRDAGDPPVATGGGQPAVAPPGKPDGEVDTRP